MGWNGFETEKFGLEMQKPWAHAVLTGTKQIETRSYRLPNGLLNRRIDVLESEKGIDGISGLNGNIFTAKELKSKICRKGWIVIDEIIEYRNKAHFEKDAHKHLVSYNSGYAWKDDKTKVIFGWRIKEFAMYKHTQNDYKITRRLRSLFEITDY